MTTVQLEKDLVDSLKNSRQYPRQTYNELIKHMLKVYHRVNVKNQYDEFLHKVQQHKMKELWGTPEDEVWDNV
jgi:rRNA pseudouridine-1189 N-methylase Emg1 (Nep1/Mra1 family)